MNIARENVHASGTIQYNRFTELENGELNTNGYTNYYSVLCDQKTGDQYLLMVAGGRQGLTLMSQKCK